MQPAATKAKSRLQNTNSLSSPKEIASTPIKEAKLHDHSHHVADTSHHRSRKPLQTQLSSVKVLTARLHYLPLLILSFACFCVLWYIFTSVHPHQLANFLFFHSYLPVLLLFFGATFFLFTFVLLNSRRAVLVSTYLTFLLFFKFQDVQLSWVLVGGLLAVIVGIELVARFTAKK